MGNVCSTRCHKWNFINVVTFSNYCIISTVVSPSLWLIMIMTGALTPGQCLMCSPAQHWCPLLSSAHTLHWSTVLSSLLHLVNYHYWHRSKHSGCWVLTCDSSSEKSLNKWGRKYFTFLRFNTFVTDILHFTQKWAVQKIYSFWIVVETESL